MQKAISKREALKIAILILFNLLIFFLLLIFKFDVYLRASIALIIFTVSLSFSKQFSNIRNSNKEAFNFLITFLATLFGVYVAISASNINEANKEKRQKIEILKVIKNDIDETIANQKQVFLDIKNSLNGDTLLYLNHRNTIRMFLNNYEFPTLLSLYLNDGSFITSLNPSILGVISIFKKLLNNNVAHISDSSIQSIYDLRYTINQGLSYSNALKTLINLQIKILEHDLNNDQARDELLLYINRMPMLNSKIILDSSYNHQESIFLQ